MSTNKWKYIGHMNLNTSLWLNFSLFFPHCFHEMNGCLQAMISWEIQPTYSQAEQRYMTYIKILRISLPSNSLFLSNGWKSVFGKLYEDSVTASLYFAYLSCTYHISLYTLGIMLHKIYCFFWLGVVAPACNPRYSRARSRKISIQDWVRGKSKRPYLRK